MILLYFYHALLQNVGKQKIVSVFCCCGAQYNGVDICHKNADTTGVFLLIGSSIETF